MLNSNLNTQLNLFDYVPAPLPVIALPETSTIELPLRDYQVETLNRFEEVATRCDRVLLQQPTGAGKSLIIIGLIAKYLQANKRVIVFVHKIELLDQMVDHLTRWLPDVVFGIIGDKTLFPHRNFKASVQLASIGAFTRLGVLAQKALNPHLLIFDEAHHCHAASWAELFKTYPHSKIVGVTATPIRGDGRGLRRLSGDVPGFEELINGVPVQKLIERGYLVPFKIYAAGNGVDADKAGIKLSKGDYNQTELADFVESELQCAEVVRVWAEKYSHLQTLAYPVSVDYSRRLRDAFVSQGFKAAHIDADTPKGERKRILKAFADKEIRVICQHSIVIEGFDVPAIACILSIRPTKSVSIWFQILGRGLRPSQDKDACIVLDYTTNYRDLPWPTHEIHWSLDPISLPKGTEFCFTCKQCSHVYRLLPKEREELLTRCPSCGAEHRLDPPKNKNDEKDSKAALREVKANLGLTEISEDYKATQELSLIMSQCMMLKLICAAKKNRPMWQLFELFRYCQENHISMTTLNNVFVQKQIALNLLDLSLETVQWFIKDKFKLK